MDPEEDRDELRRDLITLHAALKNPNKSLGYSDAIIPLDLPKMYPMGHSN